MYRKFPKYSDTQKTGCNHSKIWTMWLYHRVMSPNDADRMAKSEDLDQTAVWSGSALFAQAYPSENLGSLWYNMITYIQTYKQIYKIHQAILYRIIWDYHSWSIILKYTRYQNLYIYTSHITVIIYT